MLQLHPITALRFLEQLIVLQISVKADSQVLDFSALVAMRLKTPKFKDEIWPNSFVLIVNVQNIFYSGYIRFTGKQCSIGFCNHGA